MKEYDLTAKTFRDLTLNGILVRVFMDLPGQWTNIQLFAKGPSEDKSGPLQKVSYDSAYLYDDEFTSTTPLVWQMIPIKHIGSVLHGWSYKPDMDTEAWRYSDQLVICKKPHQAGHPVNITNIIPARLHLDFGRLQEKLLMAKSQGLENLVMVETFRRRLERFLYDHIKETEKAAERISNLVV